MKKGLNDKPLSRTEKAKYNIIFSLLQQGISLICGLLIPRLMIYSFGSEAYGAITSIASFLSYIVILDGGVGALARSALYKALAEKSENQISSIINETRTFFRRVAVVFVVYVFVLSFVFKPLSHSTIFGYWYTFSLVIVIALSTFAEYFIGISYSLLLQADQANYIVCIFKIISTILNTIGTIVLISMKFDILSVKLLSSILFIIRPLLLSIYVKKRYRLHGTRVSQKSLTQKGAAIGQHIAWTIHNNTDVSVLTLFSNLAYVSVYSVYNLVITQLKNTISSFSSGMEAVFGNMLAKKEMDNLHKTFGLYETLISLISVFLFSCAAVLIVPFIRLYTRNITDIEYIYPLFAVMLIIASLLYSMMMPYWMVVNAAGHFKQTQVAAYGEAAINLFISIILVLKLGLVGVAIGTVVATFFRYAYLAIYLKNNILYRHVALWVKRMIVNSFNFLSVLFIGNTIIQSFYIDSYYDWAISGIFISILAVSITLLFNYLFYQDDIKNILVRAFKKI